MVYMESIKRISRSYSTKYNKHITDTHTWNDHIIVNNKNSIVQSKFRRK